MKKIIYRSPTSGAIVEVDPDLLKCEEWGYKEIKGATARTFIYAAAGAGAEFPECLVAAPWAIVEPWPCEQPWPVCVGSTSETFDTFFPETFKEQEAAAERERL